MPNVKVTIKLIRNILISLISTIWIFPLHCSFMALSTVLAEAEPDIFNVESEMISFSYVQLSEWFFTISMIILSIAVFFWTFVAANKLWPIKTKEGK